MPEPKGYHRSIDSVPKKCHCGCMSQHMRSHSLAPQRLAMTFRGLHVLGDHVGQAVGCQLPTPGVRKQWLLGCVRLPLTQPTAKDSLKVCAERRASVRSPLPAAADMRAGAKDKVIYSHVGQLRRAKPCLDCERQQRAISAATPCLQLRCGNDRGDFVVVEVVDQPTRSSLGWDRKDALGLSTVIGLVQRDIAKERVDCCESRVAGSWPVAPS